jgi:hypothetical protein
MGDTKSEYPKPDPAASWQVIGKGLPRYFANGEGVSIL